MPFPTSALPPALMDLTMLRLSGVMLPKQSNSTLVPFISAQFRRIHQAAALTSDPKFEPFTEPKPMLNESHRRYA